MLKFLKSSHVDPKPGYDNAHYYTMQITASQFLDKLCDTSASVTINYISQTVQASINWIGLSSVLRPRQHSIGYMGDGFYRSKDPTNSIKVLKEQIVHRQIKHTISRHEHKTQQVPQSTLIGVTRAGAFILGERRTLRH